jgi:hypothetical protein
MASFEFVQWEHLSPAIDRCRDAVYSPSRIQTLEPTRHPRQPAYQYADIESPCGRLNCFGCANRNNKPVFREDAKRAERLLTTKTKRSTRDEGLMHTLCDVHLCEASDPRDLIYACIALTDHHYGVQPNYANGNTLEDVLTDLACKVIIHDGNLDILRLALSTHKGNACHGVPSWGAGLAPRSRFSRLPRSYWRTTGRNRYRCGCSGGRTRQSWYNTKSTRDTSRVHNHNKVPGQTLRCLSRLYYLGTKRGTHCGRRSPKRRMLVSLWSQGFLRLQAKGTVPRVGRQNFWPETAS